jgi:hypothetical protein
LRLMPERAMEMRKVSKRRCVRRPRPNIVMECVGGGRGELEPCEDACLALELIGAQLLS